MNVTQFLNMKKTTQITQNLYYNTVIDKSFFLSSSAWHKNISKYMMS